MAVIGFRRSVVAVDGALDLSDERSECVLLLGYFKSADTAPPKPSVQTRFVLDAMAAGFEKEENNWQRVLDNIDMMFANQQHMMV